jgi:hypothetical protein
MNTTKFWTIAYGKQENMDYSQDDDDMKYAYITWDCKNEQYEDMMTVDYRRWSESPRPVLLGWFDELITHIGKDHYIDTIRFKWSGEFLVFYRPVPVAKPSPFTHVASDEEREERRKKLNEKGVIIQTKETMKLLRNTFKRWAKTDLAFACLHDILQLSVYNDAEMKEQMLLWKDLAQRHTITVLDGNNFTKEIDGKEYHFLTITPITHDTMIDPIGIAVGFVVNGYIVGFRRKENRDAVFKYVKKFCKEKK